MNIFLRFWQFILMGLFLANFFSSCSDESGRPDQSIEYDLQAIIDSQAIITEVESAVRAFHAADTARDAAAVLDLLWPEYTMLADGKRLSYADVAAGAPAFMASLRVFHTEWKDLQIIPLGENIAVSSFIFYDSLVTHNGKVTRSRGPNTFVWERREGQWRVRYADADHYSN